MTTDTPSPLPPPLPPDAFWALVAQARARTTAARTFAEQLTELLTGRPRDEIVAFELRFNHLHGALYRWDVWAAGYLVGGGCSDDSFMDFRAGVIALGRDWYERVLASPDSLAGHPWALGEDPAELEEVFDEDTNYTGAMAFAATYGEDEWHRLFDAGQHTLQEEPDMGEDFDFDDDAEMHRRLPRLAALFL
ncbi:DUF4240 domain-containing protein [Kitasatospora sp. NPDC056327]|uniref:DUF4240 domain-containing protein n=1 Tax=Kitasatospora sp. NPDC056327 TaxID=3345785 RepID=UPI0035DA82D1